METFGIKVSLEISATYSKNIRVFFWSKKVFKTSKGCTDVPNPGDTGIDWFYWNNNSKVRVEQISK